MPKVTVQGRAKSKDKAPPPVKSKPKPKSKLPDNFLPEADLVLKHLPSKGLAYPKGSEIKYRGFVVGEVKEISQRRNMPIKTKIEKILDGVECNFDKMDITVQDLIFISFQRQMQTLGTDKLEFSYRCGGCRKESVATISLTKGDVEFKDMEAPKLPITVEINGVSCEFMPLTIGKFIELIGDEDDIDEEDIGFDSAAKQVSNLDFETAKKLFYSCSLVEAKIIARVTEYLDHSLQPLKLSCTNMIEDKICGHKSEMSLEGGEGFMLPFREHEGTVEQHIHFG